MLASADDNQSTLVQNKGDTHSSKKTMYKYVTICITPTNTTNCNYIHIPFKIFIQSTSDIALQQVKICIQISCNNLFQYDTVHICHKISNFQTWCHVTAVTLHRPGPSKSILSFKTSDKNVSSILSPPMHNTCTEHPVLFDLMTPMLGYLQIIQSKPPFPMPLIYILIHMKEINFHNPKRSDYIFASFNLHVFQLQMGKQNILNQKAAIIPQNKSALYAFRHVIFICYCHFHIRDLCCMSLYDDTVFTWYDCLKCSYDWHTGYSSLPAFITVSLYHK